MVGLLKTKFGFDETFDFKEEQDLDATLKTSKEMVWLLKTKFGFDETFYFKEKQALDATLKRLLCTSYHLPGMTAYFGFHEQQGNGWAIENQVWVRRNFQFQGGAILGCNLEEVLGSRISAGVQPLQEALVGATASSERRTFNIYNDYAYKVGFSVRYSKVRHRCKSKGGGLCMRHFCCWKAGFKQEKGKNHKDHTNIDVRAGCKAFIQFHIDEDGKWIATRHDIEHNHALCSRSKRHLLLSHRKVSEEDILFVKQLRESGVGVADAYRVLKKQAAGSPSIGYGVRDSYNTQSTKRQNV